MSFCDRFLGLLVVTALFLLPVVGFGQDEPVKQAAEPAVTADVPASDPKEEMTEEKQPADKSTAKKDKHDHAGHDHSGGAHDQEHPPLGTSLPVYSIIPFALILLAIAILPLTFGHWWEHNSNKGIVAAILALPILGLLISYGGPGIHLIQHLLTEYISFIVLLAALYIISGGVYIKGSLNGTPLANTTLLGIGAVIASFVGTTGASVLLIRPLLRANKSRVNKVHVVVFFIFIVSNCGGLLTPLGDPPLFLGFLKGVPFTWTFQLWPQWLLVNIALLVIFNVWDQFALDREEKERAGSQLEEVMKHEPLTIQGGLNFLFLLGIVLTIYFSGVKGSLIDFPMIKETIMFGPAEILMIALAVAAYLTTSEENRTANNFTFGPIIEVAVLFIGIFITMGPALEILNAWGGGHREDLGAMPVTDVWHYFWAAGTLSSFLDNAPTYLTFASLACGKAGVSGDDLAAFLATGPTSVLLLKAISCGSVFMGANTYIGNGPNFMVKAIAEENGVKMPSFFGYMAYSCGILIPIFIVVTFVFFR